MKTLISFILTVSMSALAAPKPPSFMEVARKSKTLNDFTKRLEGKVSPYFHSYLKEKMKPVANASLKVMKLSDKKLMITVGKATATIEDTGTVAGSELRHSYLINNKEFEFDLSKSPDDHMKEILKLLPQQKERQVSWFDFIIPRAEAQFAEFLTGFVGGLGLTLLATTVMNSNRAAPPPPRATYTSYSCYGCGQTWGSPWQYSQYPQYGGYAQQSGGYYQQGGGHYQQAQPVYVVPVQPVYYVPRQPAYYIYSSTAGR